MNRRTSLLLLFVLMFCYYAPAQSDEDCLGCHSDESLTMERNGKEVSLFVNDAHLKSSPHAKLKCISCHTGFSAEDVPHKENIRPINCLSCHKNAPTKHLFHPQMLKANGSNGPKDTNCKGCHGTHKILRVDHPSSPFNSKNLSESCGNCHPDKKKEFENSAHAIALSNGVLGAPDCITCHKQSISTLANKNDSLQAKLSREKLCLSCHQDNPDVRARVAPTVGFINAYEHSVHGKALNNKGNVKAAGCIDCHSSHAIKKGTDPESSVFKANIPATCGKCHDDIRKVYDESIHGVAVAKGNPDAPMCTDCHGEHNILKTTDPNSPVFSQNVSLQVCSPCHSSVKLSEKYGLSANRYQTFKSTYHGLALIGGEANVANCGSCHGVHNIKPSSDPTSTIHKANLVKTCGKCHPGANENFTVGSIHVTMTEKEEPVLYWIATIYIILIGSTIGGMFFHNFIDFVKKAKIKKMKQRGLIPYEHHSHALYLRMNLAERIQHFLLLTSFFTLVITGFMLRFPDAWWVRYIRDLSVNAFEWRSIIHRVAAVVMVAASFYHLYYISFTARGRQLIIDLLPRLKDATDAIGVLKYNLGFAKEKPKLDRFSYVEKAEYWALIWGTIVMTVTGFIMWFDNTFIGLLTKLGWDIARTIHYYEAWLAFLSIIVWHFYFVLFNPDIYPMNIAWIKGTITEEEMAEEHPLELERIKAQKKAEDSQTDNSGQS